MIRILLGGSPCTKWSIAQKNDRETQPSGWGWDLFLNYLIAKEKFKPDYFLYENNKSAAQPIKDQIKLELRVGGGSGARYDEINSALVSAQNRQRFYVHNTPNFALPQDRGIYLKDVIDSGVAFLDKSYALTTRCSGAIADDTLKRHRHTMVAEPVIFQRPHGFNAGGIKESKSPTLTANAAWEQNNLLVQPVCVQEQVYGRKANADGTYDRRYEARTDGKCGTLTGTNRQNAVAIPVTSWRDKKIKELVNKYGYLPEIFNLYNLCEIGEKSPTITAGVACNNTSSDIQIIQRVREDMAAISMYVVRGGANLHQGQCISRKTRGRLLHNPQIIRSRMSPTPNNPRLVQNALLKRAKLQDVGQRLDGRGNKTHFVAYPRNRTRRADRGFINV